VTVDWLLSELLKDRAYYEKSGGGVTLSGGEPTFQPDFAEALLRELKGNNVSTALDTCGLCSRQTLDRLLPHANLILFDLKLFDPALHQKFTGAGNEQILENLEYVRDYIHNQKRSIALWIRTPLIPGATAAADNLIAIGRHLADKLNGTVSRWELCSFNNLCRDQYTRLGMQWAYAQTPLMTREDLARCEQAAKSSGICPDIVLVTGAAREIETT
jgi:pyruvate formate lyase activating enzyme